MKIRLKFKITLPAPSDGSLANVKHSISLGPLREKAGVAPVAQCGGRKGNNVDKRIIPATIPDIDAIALRFSKEIGAACNKKYPNGAQMAGVVGTRVLQNIAISVTLQLYPAGSVEGLKFLENLYNGMKQDALNHWNEAQINKPRIIR